MNPWKIFWSTFAIVFLAELGDKTQIAAFSLAAAKGSVWAVFLGAGLALVAATFVAVTFGHALARRVPERTLRTVAAGLFLATGAWLFYKLLS